MAGSDHPSFEYTVKEGMEDCRKYLCARRNSADPDDIASQNLRLTVEKSQGHSTLPRCMYPLLNAVGLVVGRVASEDSLREDLVYIDIPAFVRHNAS